MESTLKTSLRHVSLNPIADYLNTFSSYTYEDEEGVFPESQFVFDLQLPAEFKPRIGDGEVQEFYLLPIDKVSAFVIF